MRTYAITAADEGRTLPGLLRNLLFAAPRGFLRKILRDGAVTVNDSPPDPARRLRAGDTVALRESGRVLELIARGTCPLDVLYDDPDLLVLNKPAGLAVHPTQDPAGEDLASQAASLAEILGHHGAYHVVNRLDRFTSGAVLLAPGAGRASDFCRLFERREVDKRYVALVGGAPPDAGTLEFPVEGRPARTTFEVLSRGPGAALVLAQPLTGRKHQIRQHFAAAGHPLLGDRRYGGPPLPGVEGALLHAVGIALVHPSTGERLEIVAPLPAHLRQAAADAGLGPGATGAVLDALARAWAGPGMPRS